MSLFCIKTGFYAYSDARAKFYYGDAFVLPAASLRSMTMEAHGASFYYGDDTADGADHLLLRICAESNGADPNRIHINFSQESHWFDERAGVRAGEAGGRTWTPSSTMLIAPGEWRWLGYYGQEHGK